MPEWWSYTLSDFLLFSPRTYYRMIERHNEAVWPVQLATGGLGLAVAALLRRPSPRRGRAVSAVLAALWIWVAWSFVWQRYATINWAATYLVWLFVLEAVLLLWLGVARRGLVFAPRSGVRGWLGMALLLLGLPAYPVIAPLLGRGWHQAEVFGIVPDPTAVATLGLLLLAEGPHRWMVMVPPAIWCLVAGATLYAMGSAEAWVPAAAAVLALAGSGTRAGAAT
ncbi:MAG: DUF6064 family protein [Gemmatimonadales bacterium]